MIANGNRTEDLRTSAYIDVTADNWQSIPIARSDCYLMEYQAIDAGPGARMNYNPVGMGKYQAATDLACQRDIGGSDDRPEPMAQYKDFAANGRQQSRFASPILVATDCQKQLASWVPELCWRFTPPIGCLRANGTYAVFQAPLPKTISRYGF